MSPAPALDPARTALLVMDYQHAALALLPEGWDCEALLARVEGAISDVRTKGGTIAYVRVGLPRLTGTRSRPPTSPLPRWPSTASCTTRTLPPPSTSAWRPRTATSSCARSATAACPRPTSTSSGRVRFAPGAAAGTFASRGELEETLTAASPGDVGSVRLDEEGRLVTRRCRRGRSGRGEGAA